MKLSWTGSAKMTSRIWTYSICYYCIQLHSSRDVYYVFPYLLQASSGVFPSNWSQLMEVTSPSPCALLEQAEIVPCLPLCTKPRGHKWGCLLSHVAAAYMWVRNRLAHGLQILTLWLKEPGRITEQIACSTPFGRTTATRKRLVVQMSPFDKQHVSRNAIH